MIYNFKDDDCLQIADFCCEDCLVSNILEAVDCARRYETIEVYAKAELIEKIFIELLNPELDYEFKIAVVDFEGKCIDGDYDDLYCLSINDLNEIWIEPALRYDDNTSEYKPFNSEATLAFVYQEDTKQDVLDMLDKNDIPTLLFGFDED